MKIITVLYARHDSIYKQFPQCQVYDKDKNADTWPGGTPIIAHPPCAQWGRMAQWAKQNHDEKNAAIKCIELANKWGGIVEHPWTSKLWNEPFINKNKLITIDQFWFGHRAQKRTTLYISGISLKNLPPIPYTLAYVTHKGCQYMAKKEREATPPLLAKWLIDTASGVTGTSYIK